jgi:hypothetical protein
MSKEAAGGRGLNASVHPTVPGIAPPNVKAVVDGPTVALLNLVSGNEVVVGLFSVQNNNIAVGAEIVTQVTPGNFLYRTILNGVYIGDIILVYFY